MGGLPVLVLKSISYEMDTQNVFFFYQTNKVSKKENNNITQFQGLLSSY